MGLYLNNEYFEKGYFKLDTKIVFHSKDIKKTYTLEYLHEKIEKEIIIIKDFIIESKNSNKNTEFFIQVLQALLFEADFII